MSELPVTVDIRAYRGDTWSQSFRLLSEPGTPLDLTGAVVEAWAASKTATEALSVATDAPAGVVTLMQPNGGLVAGSYSYDIEVSLDGAITTWVRGTLIVQQDVTNADV